MAAEYKIGPQDKLKIKVYDWPALSDEATVGDDGLILLPLVGGVKAADLSRRELANSIARLLQEHERLPSLPYASVEIAEYRPFYVLGHVQRPGDYHYRPGLTALMAVSIAGGVYRASENLRLDRDILASQGTVRGLDAKRWDLKVRIARLLSERAGKSAFDMGDDKPAGDQGRIAAAIEQESAIMASRRKGFDNQMDGLRRRIGGYKEEIDLLGARMASLVRQQKSVETEAQAMSALGAKGLTILPRQASLDRLAAQIDGDQRQVDTLISEAKQNVIQTEIAITKLIDERERDIASQLKSATAQLVQTEQQIATQRALVQEAQALGSTQLSRTVAPESALRFEVQRRGANGKPVDLELQRDDSLEPGDVLTVQLVNPGEAGATLGGGRNASSEAGATLGGEGAVVTR